MSFYGNPISLNTCTYINLSPTIFINLRMDTLYLRKNSHYLILIINRYIYIKFTTQIHKNILIRCSVYGRLISSSDYYDNQQIKLLLHTHQPYHNSYQTYAPSTFSSSIIAHDSFFTTRSCNCLSQKDKQYFSNF